MVAPRNWNRAGVMIGQSSRNTTTTAMSVHRVVRTVVSFGEFLRNRPLFLDGGPRDAGAFLAAGAAPALEQQRQHGEQEDTRPG